MFPLAGAEATRPAGKPPLLAAELSGVDLAQVLAIARRKVDGLDVIESARGACIVMESLFQAARRTFSAWATL